MLSSVIDAKFSHIKLVSRGDWLGKPANLKAENNGA